MKDHDTLFPSKDGKTWDLRKRDASAPRPHADGCVGCRRSSECVSCGVYCVLDFNRCVSGACLGCCERLHAPHDVTYRLVVNPLLVDPSST
jgi:hypothetical protein